MTLPLADHVLLHLAAADRRAAARQAVDLLDDGLTLPDFVDEGLAPAMAQVGALWQSAMWSVADEHVATAVAEAALSAVALRTVPPADGPEVVVACAEGDWHSLPSRMLAEVLGSQGCRVRFLGASQPTDMLLEHVQRHRPQAVLLSCSVPTALPDLALAVEGVRELGLPVYVGGRALGDHPGRAHQLGADGWSPTASSARELLDRAAPRAASTPMPDLLAHHRRMESADAWVEDAAQRLRQLVPALRHLTPRLVQRTRADLAHLLLCASLSLMVRDPSVLSDQRDWLVDLLVARGVRADAVDLGLMALARSTPAAADLSALGSILEAAVAGPAPSR